MDVKQIDAKDTYPIRNQILRPGRPVKDCEFNGDNDELTFHLGAYVDDKLVSVASFYFHRHPKIDDEHQFQLRGMATLEEYQGQGFSSALLNTAFPLIKKNHVNTVWCNARKTAAGFYQKVGFEKISDEFDIPTVGPHYLMKKTLD